MLLAGVVPRPHHARMSAPSARNASNARCEPVRSFGGVSVATWSGISSRGWGNRGRCPAARCKTRPGYAAFRSYAQCFSGPFSTSPLAITTIAPTKRLRVRKGFRDSCPGSLHSSARFPRTSVAVNFGIAERVSLPWWRAAEREIHPQARSVPRVHLLLHQDSRSPARRGRDAAILQRDASDGPPHDPGPGRTWFDQEDAGRSQVHPTHIAADGIAGLEMLI